MEESQNIIPVVLMGIALLVLIFLSAFFSASETSYTTVSNFKYETHYKKKKKNWIFKINLKLLNNYQMTLSTILIANTLVNVAASTISALFFEKILLIASVGEIQSLATGIATGVITFLILIFGEFLPKSIARKHSLLFITIVAPIIYLLYFIFFPINWLLNKIIKDDNNSQSATEKEIDTLIDIVSNEGVLESNEAWMVSNSLKFDETKIAAVMVKKADIVSVNYEFDKKQFLNAFIESGYSRLPVIKNNNIIGIVTIKDFLKYINEDNLWFDVDNIIQPIIKISQYQTLASVFREMQINQMHMALVKKNMNSQQIIGLVTMEDLIETIMGEIRDEHDDNKPISKINDFTWKVSWKTKARNFFINAKIPIETENKLTIEEWFKTEFNVEKFENNKCFENELYKVLVKIKRKEKYFIIEKM